MDNLPPEILVQIFLILPVDDLVAVKNCCVRWRSIVEDFHLWKVNWLRLLDVAEQSTLNRDARVLRESKMLENYQNSCFKLNNMLRLNTCLRTDKTPKYGYAVLKTHYSHISLTVCKKYSNFRRINGPCYFLKHLNDSPSKNDKYLEFRSTAKLRYHIDKLFNNKHEHLEHMHLGLLIYCYPMSASDSLRHSLIQQFFECCHIDELILIPRVLMLCKNLFVSDAIVVYSTSRTTEIAVVVNEEVLEDRWCEIPVAGWTLAQNLQATIQWMHPNNAPQIYKYDDPAIKRMCWIKGSQFSEIQGHLLGCCTNTHENGFDEMFTLKSEQYQAAEVMYAELNLCAVILKLMEGLSNDIMGDCLNHVLLTGGNCKLKHLNMRVQLDLMKEFPQYAYTITTSVHDGPILAYTPHEEFFLSDATNKFVPGQKIRMTRTDYILNDI